MRRLRVGPLTACLVAGSIGQSHWFPDALEPAGTGRLQQSVGEHAFPPQLFEAFDPTSQLVLVPALEGCLTVVDENCPPEDSSAEVSMARELVEYDDTTGFWYQRVGTGNLGCSDTSKLTGDERLLHRRPELAKVASGDKVEGSGVRTRLIKIEIDLDPGPVVWTVHVAVPGTVPREDRTDSGFNQNTVFPQQFFHQIVEAWMVKELVEPFVFLKKRSYLPAVAARDVGESAGFDFIKVTGFLQPLHGLVKHLCEVGDFPGRQKSRHVEEAEVPELRLLVLSQHYGLRWRRIKDECYALSTRKIKRKREPVQKNALNRPVE